MDVSVDVSLDTVRFGDSLGSIDKKLSDSSTVMSDAADILYWSVLTNFAAGGRPKRWEELAESTIRSKGHAVPLVDTGKMIGGIRRESGEGYAKVAVSAKYAAFHHTGGEFMPARPFMLIQPEDRSLILEKVARSLTEER